MKNLETKTPGSNTQIPLHAPGKQHEEKGPEAPAKSPGEDKI